ncbi:hypothetical protein VT98_11763 [Candidatus Electrothrix communis]|uniref:Tetratricopeptide repeat-containing protein n=1 Tax=Candidatus Electrothrix communis TaxID=1859133 RepID=A0A444J547_9BACT|nr:hypothetical protein VT98_11763 [Candidatus Electrothrix communis]
MKTTLLAVTLFFIQAVLFSGLVLAEDYSLNALEKEARTFAKIYTAKGNLPPKPQEADLLRRAADIMVTERQCAAAIPLYRQAALFSGQPDADLWLAVARANSCAKQWTKASQGGWLAYGAADNDKLRAAALSLTGAAWRNARPPIEIGPRRPLISMNGSIRWRAAARMEKSWPACGSNRLRIKNY